MSRERIQTGRGERGWEPILRAEGLNSLGHEGKWEVSGHSLKVDAIGEGAWLSITDREIEDFELRAGLTAVTGGNASIFFRQHDGGSKCYEFDLKCDLQAVLVSKFNRNDARMRKIISAVNFELMPGGRYDVEIAVRSESITTYVNGKLLNQVRDGDYEKGHICLTAWQSKAEFYDPRLRVY